MIHPTVVIDDEVKIGLVTYVWSNAVIRKGTTIGSDCVIGSNCYIGLGVHIGNGTRIQHGVFIPNYAQIGNRVFIGPNVTFTDDKHPIAGNAGYHSEPPIVEDDVSVGAGATILPGVRLEQGCTIGAGAVVTRRVPKGVTVIGNPAQTIQDYRQQTWTLSKISRWLDRLLAEWHQ